MATRNEYRSHSKYLRGGYYDSHSRGVVVRARRARESDIATVEELSETLPPDQVNGLKASVTAKFCSLIG